MMMMKKCAVLRTNICPPPLRIPMETDHCKRARGINLHQLRGRKVDARRRYIGHRYAAARWYLVLSGARRCFAELAPDRQTCVFYVCVRSREFGSTESWLFYFSRRGFASDFETDVAPCQARWTFTSRRRILCLRAFKAKSSEATKISTRDCA